MFYHSGYPQTWQTLPSLYAIYEHTHDCFLYVHHDLDLVKKVKSLLSSKTLTWIYKLRLPSNQALEHAISNLDAIDYTLQPDTARPDPVYYLTNSSKVVQTINCTEVNMLGQMTGIEHLPKPLNSDLKQLQQWTQFLAWVVAQIKNEELFDDELLARALIADIHNNKSLLIDNSIYMIASKMYQVLLVEHNVKEACEKIGKLAQQAVNATSMNIDLRPFQNLTKLQHYNPA